MTKETEQKAATGTKPNPPKRAISSFFLFKEEKSKEFKDKHPEMKVSDIVKLLSEEWKKQSTETKDTYTAIYAKNKAEYDKEMKKYKELHGEPEKKKRPRKDKKDKKSKKENKTEKKTKKEQKVVEKVAEKAKEEPGKKSANTKAK